MPIMGYSVEVLFDENSEERIKQYWKMLYDDDSGSFMYLKGGNPHISLAVYNNEMACIEQLKEIVTLTFKDIKQFKLELSSIGVFPGEEMVTFLNPKPSPKLLNLQSALYSEIRRQKIKKYYWGHYKPKIWVPHCTMIVNETAERHLKGIDLLIRYFEPFSVTVTRVSVAEFFPYQCLMEIHLDII
jgi:2'-5' RNA ligase